MSCAASFKPIPLNLTSLITQKLLYLGVVMTFSHRPPSLIQYVQYMLANCLGVKADLWKRTLLQ